MYNVNLNSLRFINETLILISKLLLFSNDLLKLFERLIVVIKLFILESKLKLLETLSMLNFLASSLAEEDKLKLVIFCKFVLYLKLFSLSPILNPIIPISFNIFSESFN